MKEFGNKIVDFFKNAGLDILYGIIILVVGLLLCALIKAVLKKILLRWSISSPRLWTSCSR